MLVTSRSRRRRARLSLALAALAALVSAAPAGAGDVMPSLPPDVTLEEALAADVPAVSAFEAFGPPPPCPPVVVENTTLRTDCVGPIVIANNDVTLNLAGHRVTCLGDATRTGIVLDTQSNVRITNGTVERCGIGILVKFGLVGHHLENLTLVNNVCCGPAVFPATGEFNTGDGIRIRGSDRNQLANIVAERNAVGLFIASGSADNTVRSSRFSGSRPFSNIEIQTAFRNVIEGTKVTNAAFDGILLSQGSSENVIRSVDASDGNLNGIRIGFWGGGNDNVIQASEASRNRADGIALILFTQRTLVQANRAFNNARRGIVAGLLANSSLIVANTARENAVFDMADDNPNCDANVWESNNFVTANQPQCIE